MKRLLAILTGLLLFVCIGQLAQADWRYNPFTGKLDYHETGLPSGTSGDIAYYDGSDWVALNKGSDGEVLTLASGLPAWAAGGAESDVKVGIDAAATAGYLGAAYNDGVFRVDQNELTYTDGGNFITIGLANHDTARTALGLMIGTNVQAYDADLTTYAGITPSANMQAFLDDANFATMRTTLGLAIGTNVQAWDADLDTYAGITPSVNVQTFLGVASSAAMMAHLSGTATSAFSFNGQNVTIEHAGFGNVGPNADISVYVIDELIDSDNSPKDKTSAVNTSYAAGVIGKIFISNFNTQNWTDNHGLRGVESIVQTGGGTGTVTGAANFLANAVIADGLVITDLYGVHITTPTGDGIAGDKVTNYYGTKIEDVAGVGETLSYALYTGTGDVRFGGDTLVAGDLEVNEAFTYDAVQTATGDGTTTIDWGLGNIMYFTFGAANEAFTFTAPPGVALLYLVLKQDATGSRTATWPGTVLWPGDVAPTLTTTAAYVDIVTLIWDGSNYHGICNYDFR